MQEAEAAAGGRVAVDEEVAVLIGRLDVQKQRPDVRFSAFANNREVAVKQDVNAELSARLLEVDSGATVWTDGAKCTTTLANGLSGSSPIKAPLSRRGEPGKLLIDSILSCQQAAPPA